MLTAQGLGCGSRNVGEEAGEPFGKSLSPGYSGLGFKVSGLRVLDLGLRD